MTIINRFPVLLLFLSLFLSYVACAQERFDSIQSQLQSISNENPGLNQKVELNVSDVSLAEFLNALAVSNKLNISVDESLNFSVSNNFSNVTVIEVIMFLARKHDLEVKLIGSIINISKPKAPTVITPAAKPKTFTVQYDKAKDLIDIDLKKDTLYSVAKEISKATGKNLIVPQDLENTLVSGFIQNQNLSTALEMLAYANNLKATTTPEGVFVFEKKEGDKNGKDQGDKSFSNTGSKKNSKQLPGVELKIDKDLISLSAYNIPIQDIITGISEKLNLNYFIFSDIKGYATLNIENSTYENLLTYLLNETEYTFKKEGEIYLIGNRASEGLRGTKVLQLKFRTVDKILDFIPAEMKKGVELKIFPDQNSIIVSGSQPRILEIENFIREVDRVVPVVSIEVIVLEVSNTSAVAKGLTAGLSETPVKTEGTIFPGLDLTISSGSINAVLDKIGGIGSLVLGRVSPNFYVSLQLLETNGMLKVRSTPKLSTLNGHEASLSIGKTEYYLEVQNTVVGTQNPQNITAQTYKAVNADLSLSINPIVSGDEQITLDIKVKQSTFTARISPTAPPGTVTRDFQSLIRIKNDEMIMLGGLEENSSNDSGKGFPGLARVPVLKWLFSNRNKERKKSKLVILVRPTVLY